MPTSLKSKRRWWLIGCLCGAIVIVIAGWLIRNSVERERIAARYVEFHNAFSGGQTEAAFQFMSPSYRANHTLKAFADEFRAQEDDLFALEPGHSIRIRGLRAWLYPRRVEWLQLWSGPDYEWEKINGEWFLTGRQKYYLD